MIWNDIVARKDDSGKPERVTLPPPARVEPPLSPPRHTPSDPPITEQPPEPVEMRERSEIEDEEQLSLLQRTWKKYNIPISVFLILAVIGIIFLKLAGGPAPFDGTIHMGLLVKKGSNRGAMEQDYQKLLGHLNVGLGKRNLKIKLAEPYVKLSELADDLREGKIHVGGELSPYQYVKAQEQYGVRAFISPYYGGSSTYRAVIFVSRDARLEGHPNLSPVDQKAAFIGYMLEQVKVWIR